MSEAVQWSAPELPKWPEMRVVGDRVTPDQAAEIIVRTDHAVDYPCCNDHAWEGIVRAICGVKDMPRHDEFTTEDERRAAWAAYQSASDTQEKALGRIHLEYVGASRIASSYIGGPHGWIAWDGFVGQSGHNIGKWPSCEAVREEWATLAEAFPFLNLRCQLLNGEESEEGCVPVVEYVVKDGVVTMGPPGETIRPTGSRDIHAEMSAVLFNPMRERGCTAEQLRDAVALVQRKFAASTTPEVPR